MTISSHSNLLGIAGLLPFLCLPVFSVLGAISYFEAISFFNQYSAIILSFLGGVIWFDGITNKKPIWQLYFAMLPSIVGWISLVILPPKIALIVLMVSFFCLLLIEWKLLVSESWYQRLRLRLTSVAMAGHLMMLYTLNY